MLRICEDCIHNKVCNEWAVISGIPFVNANTCENFMTADVVPKSEVEILQAEINAYSIAKKYDAEHFMADIKTLQMENATLIKNRDKLLQSYARGIFEEIEKILNESRQGEYSKEFGFLNRVSYNGYVLSKGLAELKKKYTEGEK